MSNENNKMQVDIENLIKQNVNDLSSIKELFRKLQDMENKISQNKYINSNLANKLKKEYENLKKIILDENIQAKLTDDIEKINSQLDNITINLNRINGESDYTQALTRAIASCIGNRKYIIKIPQGVICDITNVVINKPHIRITGGTIRGTLTINIPDDIGYFEIDNVRFLGKNPLIIKRLCDGNISKCFFEGSETAIYLNPIEGSTGQTICRLKIENNYFMLTNYNVKGTKIDSSQLAIADIHFKNNMCKWASIKHIELQNIDGCIIEGNTFFSQGETKETTIEIGNWSNWTIISNNNIFESGHEGVKLHNPQNFSISNNNFAWCGQYKRTGAITIYSLNSSTFSCVGKIVNNTLAIPSQSGIVLDNVDFIETEGNLIQLETSNQFYKGTDEIDLNKFFGVCIEKTNENPIITVGNIINKGNGLAVNNKFKFLNTYNNETSVSVKTNTLDGRYDFISIDIEGLSISNLTNGVEGKEVIIYNNSNSATIINSTIQLNNSRNFKMKQRQSLTLKYLNGCWTEISRGVPNMRYDITVTDSRTTIDSSDYISLYALNNETPTTITAITNPSYVGQEITLLDYKGNTTLSNSSSLRLKGNDSVTLPKYGLIKFITHANNWYEVSRNF